MKRNVHISLILTLAFLMTMSGCSSYATATDITTTQITSAAATTSFEPTETAAVTTPTPTPVTMEAVVMLPVSATYASLFDGTKIYSDGSRTVILKTLVKGDQVTITGTSGQYGVTAEGSYINLHLMSVVVTVTPTSAETTAAPTDPTAATKATTAPAATTKAPAATTKAPATTTAAPPVETAAPVATTAAYTPNCDNIRSLIVSNLQSRGYWFPDAVSIGNDSVGVTTNYFYSDEGFANNIINGKFANLDKLGIGIVTVNVAIEDGYLWIYSTKCAYPTA